ncbi:MAG: ATP synthase subunit I [Methylophilaceae bacterium]|nr:ATP synthase subunit I [Methylophilaceae bacterium]
MQSVTLGGVARLQLILITTGAVLTYFVVDPLAAKAVAFGGGAAVVNVLLLNWRMHRGARYPGMEARWHFRQAIFSLVERMAVTVALLAVGIELLKLAPLAMLMGFVVGQMAWMVAPLWVKFED